MASVVVTPSRLSVGVSASVPVAVEVRDAAGTLLTGRKVAWARQDPSIATVSSTGVVTDVAPGPVQIAATAVATDAAGNVISGRPASWTSGAPSVATVSAAGVVTAIGASPERAFVAVGIASIAVTPTPTSVLVGQTRQLTAVARDASNASVTGVTFEWSSSSPFDGDGQRQWGRLGCGTGVGDHLGHDWCRVRYSLRLGDRAAGGNRDGQPVGVRQRVEILSGNVLTGRAIQWTSANTLRATVNSSGLVTTSTTNKGSVTITATSEGKTGSAIVTVK